MESPKVQSRLAIGEVSYRFLAPSQRWLFGWEWDFRPINPVGILMVEMISSPHNWVRFHPLLGCPRKLVKG